MSHTGYHRTTTRLEQVPIAANLRHDVLGLLYRKR
jgi:hypothetical protein